MQIIPRLLIFCALLLPLFAGCGKKAPSALSPGYTDAVELKLKSRELAEQMLATMPNDAIQGFVAMPTAFVNQNNTSQSSPMGRLMAESLFYEFNQRGFPTREYRLNGVINVQGGRDDLAIAIAVRLRVKKKVQNLNAMWYKEFAKNFATQGDFGHESP